MALALRVTNGDTIYIGDSPLYVSHIDRGEDKRINITYKGKSYTLSDKANTSIGDQVMVGCDFGNRDNFPTYRLLFEAPREVAIKRSAIYGGVVSV